MTVVSTVDDIVALYAARGALHYGEGVTQVEHAVQCAALAEASGAPDALVVAALRHDVGHLLVDPGDFSVDDHHEAAGAEALGALFGDAVSRPVALHVAAKRYLCRIDPSYQAMLSDASRTSLALQGGAFDGDEAIAFERRPGWREAIALRKFDDTGKSDICVGRGFDEFVSLVRKVGASN